MDGKAGAIPTGKERGRMSEIKLKPCPFCGGEAEMFGNESVVFVGCKECTCITEWDDDISAEIGWNRRADYETD